MIALMTRLLQGARAFRFEGERANHAETLRETQAAISIQEGVAADPDATAEQRFWLNKHREGMENRLAVFEAKPRLTSIEMNERDAIETHLYGAPLPRGALAQAQGRIRGFLAPIAAGPWSLLLTPWTLVIAGLALTGVQTARLNHAKADLDQARRDARTAVRIAHDWEERAEHYRQGLVDAANVARQAAASLENERQAQARAQARERRRNREIANVLAHSAEPPAWRLRDDEPATDQPTAPTP